MEAIRTVKKCLFKNGSVLRMNLTIEGTWFIFLEEANYSVFNNNREMLWNGLSLHEANTEFQNFKMNPLILGDDYE